MKYFVLLVLLVTLTGTYFLWPGTKELDPQDFNSALLSTQNKVLIDLRSAKDFSEGHIPGAVNVDAAWPTFKWRIDELDTACPVFLYCRNGERSAREAAYLRSKGFISITILRGGFQQWQADRFEVTPAEIIPPAELTYMEFSRMLDLEHLVIVDFYIPWDKNCRQQEPVIDDLATTFKGSVKIFRINIDTYKHLATEMGIETIPTLQFYENGNLVETIEGVTSREFIEGQFTLREYTVMNDPTKNENREVSYISK
ncbi:MAG: thioredoxin domain-containing protein [Bacteroidota bacterium]